MITTLQATRYFSILIFTIKHKKHWSIV